MNVVDSGLSEDLLPDAEINVKEAFGFDQNLTVPAFSTRTEHVPAIDEDYRFDPDTTCLLYTSPSPRDLSTSRMPSSA